MVTTAAASTWRARRVAPPGNPGGAIDRPRRAGAGQYDDRREARGPLLGLFLDLIACPAPPAAPTAPPTTAPGGRDGPDRRGRRPRRRRPRRCRPVSSSPSAASPTTARDRTDGPADDGTDRAADRHADGCAAKGACAGAKGFGPGLFILRRCAFSLQGRDAAACVVDWMIVV
jgi:hypothetical protein